MTYAVEFHNVSRLYGDVRAVDGVSIAINDGEFFSMLGPSGSGKTTCLRLIAGFEQLSGGAITIFGKQASELPPWERDVNTVFQDYALFPHMSILDNVAYGLMVKGIDKKQRHAKAREALDKVALGFVYERKPSQLSGGQRQRCWIAMALAQQTPVILLDEPTTFLDLRYQVEILELLHSLTRHHGRTVVVVLHDLNFAVNYGDMLVFLKQGTLQGVVHDGENCTPELIKHVFDVDVQMSVNPLTGKPFFMPFRAPGGQEQ